MKGEPKVKVWFVLTNIILIYLLWAEYLHYFTADCKKAGHGLTCAVVTDIINISIMAMVLAIANIYSIQLMALFVSAEVAVLIFYKRTKKNSMTFRDMLMQIKHGKFNVIILIFVIAGILLYTLFPTKFMIGGRDPGLYFLNGIHVSETGSLQYDTDEYLNENYNDLKDIVSPGYPALFSPVDYEEMDGRPGDLSPQFMPLYTSLLAIGYDLAGVAGVASVNGFIAILSALVIYYIAKFYLNKKAAVLACILLIVNPAQIWGARITQSEMLSQLLFYCSMAVFLYAWDKSKIRYYLCAGALLGLGCLNRIDTYIYGLGLFVMLVYTIVWNREKREALWVTCIAYGLFGILGFIYGLFGSTAYFISEWHNGTLSLAVGINLVGLLAAVIAEILCIVIKNKKNIIIKLICNERSLKICCSLLGMSFAFLYFIRPRLGESFDQRAMVEFCWYTSTIMIVLMVLGIYRLLRTYSEKSEKYFLMLFIGMSSLFAYLIKPSISPDHIWASRRWITVNIPIVLLLGAYGLTELDINSKKLLRIGQGVVASYLIFFSLWQSKAFLFTSLMKGIDIQYKNIAEHMLDDKIYFTAEESVASYLRFVYGKSVYLINTENLDGISDYISRHGSILYVGKTGPLGKVRFNTKIDTIYDYQIAGKYLQETEGRFPRALYDKYYDVSIREINSDNSGEILLGKGDFQLANAYYEGSTIVASEKGGNMFYGPYMTLDSGDYELSMEVELQDSMNGLSYIDIVCNAGNDTILKHYVEEGGKINIKFQLYKETSLLEIRAFAESGSHMRCSDIRLKKAD